MEKTKDSNLIYKKEKDNKSATKGERKKKIVRKRRYRLKQEVKVYLLLLVVSVTFIVLSFTVFFKIKNISVNGVSNVYSSKEVILKSGITNGMNLLLCSKQNAAKNISDNFPYAEKVKIVKKLPSSVEINVSLGVPKYAIENQGEYFFVSNTGRVLERTYDKPENLLIIKVEELVSCQECEQIEYKNQITKDTLEKIYTSIKNSALDKINIIDISDLNKISLIYNDRIELFIGDMSEIDYKILTCNKIVKEKIGEWERGRLNVSGIGQDNKSYFTPEYMVN